MADDAIAEFRACDTTWRIRATGRRAARAVESARRTVLEFERVLNAFEPTSAVAQLNREGHVRNAHVAAIVRRADEYRKRTGGAFDIALGELERRVKAHIRTGDDLDVADAREAHHRVEGDDVWTTAPLDLNGIAKGYIVDQASATLRAHGVRGFVDGGGDIANPTGPVGVEAPFDATRFLGVVDTPWNIATSGGSKRRRGEVDHLYDPRSRRVGARHDQVTVVARRDCTEADVLATTLCVLPLAEGKALVRDWDGVEAMWLHGGTIIFSSGFDAHVWKS